MHCQDVMTEPESHYSGLKPWERANRLFFLSHAAACDVNDRFVDVETAVLGVGVPLCCTTAILCCQPCPTSRDLKRLSSPSARKLDLQMLNPPCSAGSTKRQRPAFSAACRIDDTSSSVAGLLISWYLFGDLSAIVSA